ncbi:hypothetical protein AB1Y20_022618 [Prymnesium parvum]|uniref:Biogenesis of lysosome-related organelles complex 1 subunit 7 n=1 Tax=Prymnesium parvum TaxID=97485 RepID=A0AB34JJC2_PRYPA
MEEEPLSPYGASLTSMLQPMVAKCDDSVQSVLSSQTALADQIDRVAAELQGFLKSSQIPSFSPHAQRLADVRKRVSVANATLSQVQARLKRIEAIAEQVASKEV